jgi:carbonic anhydrase
MKDLKTVSLFAALGLSFAASFALCLRAAERLDPSARLLRDASLMLLKEGNARFAAGKQLHPHQDAERRSTTAAQGQEPFATILACSDSRDPVELIFDRGVGDLFVARVAGNVAGLSELATVEYGVGHLHTPLLIVMGHSQCGAVPAVVQGAELHGHLHALAEKIKPAAGKVKAGASDAPDAVSKAIEANVWQSIEDIIKQSQVVRGGLSSGQLSVIGAIYDLEQGKVTWLGAHPAEDSMIALAAQAETDPALARRLAAPTPQNTKSPNSTKSAALPVAKTDDHSSGPNGDEGSKSSGGTKRP